MAVVPQIARITYDNGLGSRRHFVATADLQDQAAGGAVVVTVTNSAIGAIPPAAPDTFELRYITDDGATIRTVTLNNTAGSQTDTFYFTDTGLVGGSPRCGTLELHLRVVKTTGGPTATYSTDTDGTPNTPPTGFTTTILDKGWIRGTTTLVEDISNVGLGSAPNTPGAYDDSLYVRLTAGATAYVARTLSVALSAGSLSGSTDSTVNIVRDLTFANVVDERFAAAVTTVTVAVTVPNATLTGLPWTVFTSTTDDSIDVDPRIRIIPLFQLDDDTYGTPPLSKNVADHKRLGSQQGFMCGRFINARGEGINGLTYNVALDPDKPGSPVTQTGKTTTTQGGQAGWGNGFTAWSSSLPGGLWVKSVDITGPTDIDTDSYLSLAAGENNDYFLVATDLNLKMVCGTAPLNAADGGSHVTPDMDLFVGATLWDTVNDVLVSLDAEPTVTIVRFNFTTFTLQYLDSDLTTWVAVAGNTPYRHTMPENPFEPGTYVLSLNTNGWTEDDFFIVVRGVYDGAPYLGSNIERIVGKLNAHDAHTFDPTGLFK